MKTRKEIIQETADFYSEDVTRRAKVGENCVYFDPCTGNSCAVGRCLRNPKRYKNDTDLNVSALLKNKRNKMLIFKEEYRINDNTFWRSLQSFHDQDLNWDNKGLSKNGLRNLEKLLKKYNQE